MILRTVAFAFLFHCVVTLCCDLWAAVIEDPAAPASYSYVEFKRRGEPERTMKVSVSDGSGTTVEVVAGGSGEGACLGGFSPGLWCGDF